jgi:hypothetical protein
VAYVPCLSCKSGGMFFRSRFGRSGAAVGRRFQIACLESGVEANGKIDYSQFALLLVKPSI